MVSLSVPNGGYFDCSSTFDFYSNSSMLTTLFFPLQTNFALDSFERLHYPQINPQYQPLMAL